MFGWNLIHMGFLAAGAAVVVPLVIHLLFRQKPRAVVIGTLQFLRSVVQEHRRRRRVRQWLLLALRMLAVLLLALLFARPYLDQKAQRGLQQEVVLLVDRSASMGSRDSQGKSAAERALLALRTELEKYDDNVAVHIAFFDSTGVEELPLEQALTITAGSAATDYQLAVSWASDLLASSKRSDRRMVLISDLQRNGLQRSPPVTLPGGVEVLVQDVGEPLTRNLAIISAEPNSVEIRPDAPIFLRAVVRNFGALQVREIPVKCELRGHAGTVFVEQTIDISGQGSTTVDLLLPIEKDGLYQGTINIKTDDALEVDNQRSFAFEARRPERILLVDGQEGRSVFTNETYFLETALRLRTDESSGLSRSFEPERIVWSSGEGFPRLEGYRAIVLANVGRFSETDGARLEEYLRAGGSVLIFAGDQVTARSLAPLEKRGLMPGRVARESVAGRLLVDQWAEKHPALECFADPQHGDLRRILLSRCLPLEELDSEGQMLLQSESRILAAERSVGRGRCLYFGSTADRDWTELPRMRMYVPLVRQLLAYLTDQLADRAVVASRFVEKLHERPGIVPREDEPGKWTVVNLDPRESVMSRLSAEELQLALGGGTETAEDEAKSAALRLFLPPDALRADEYWKTLAWLLLAILSCEMLLASRVHA
jgi:Aerotolerance regulator N-terminal/von Willebrand factor type A domain